MSNMKIGWASCDISTDKPVIISGQAYLRISQGVHDPVTATALALDSGEDYVIFLSVDMEGTHNMILDPVREKLRALAPELDPMKVILNTTHTHAGGPMFSDKRYFAASEDPQDKMPVEVETASSDEYVDRLTSQLADAAARAWQSRREGAVAFGYGYAVVGHSRRVWYFDDISLRGKVDKGNSFWVNGHAAMYGNTDDSQFSHYEAGLDPFVNLLYTFDTEGKLTGALINLPCPSQCSEKELRLSASFWHEVRQMLRAEYGDIFLLPQSACAGDLSPRILHYKKAEERRFALKYGTPEDDFAEMQTRADIAERIVAAFKEVLSWAVKDMRYVMPITHRVRRVDLTRRFITDEEAEGCREGLETARAKGFQRTDDPYRDFKANSEQVNIRRRFLAVLDRYEIQKTRPTIPCEIHVLRIGEIAFATNPFELYMDYMHRIQARSPFLQTFCVQLCGEPRDCVGADGYLCTERAEEGKGYSAIIYSCQVSPKGGQELVEETVKDLRELAEG